MPATSYHPQPSATVNIAAKICHGIAMWCWGRSSRTQAKATSHDGCSWRRSTGLKDTKPFIDSTKTPGWQLQPCLHVKTCSRAPVEKLLQQLLTILRGCSGNRSSLRQWRSSQSSSSSVPIPLSLGSKHSMASGETRAP